jgi:hypothetical protein
MLALERGRRVSVHLTAIRNGTVKRVVFDLKRAIHHEEHALHEHASLNAIAQGVAA